MMMMIINNNDATYFLNVFLSLFFTSVGYYDVHFLSLQYEETCCTVHVSSLDGNSAQKMSQSPRAKETLKCAVYVIVITTDLESAYLFSRRGSRVSSCLGMQLNFLSETFRWVSSLQVILRPGEGPKVTGLNRRHRGRKLESHPFIPLSSTTALCKMYSVFRGTAEQTRHARQQLWKHIGD